MNAQVVGQRSGTKEPPPLFRSLPPPLSTCLPLYQYSTGSLFTSAAVYIVQRCPDTVCPYLLCPGGSFASVRPHSRADHSLGQEPVYLYTHQQCALVNVRKVYEIYADGHNLVNVWKMGNRRCPAARSRVIHCGPKAPQGAHPLIL